MAAITDEAVANLAALVGDPATARALLQATDGDAEAAANIYFAADGNIDLAALGGGGGGAGGGGGGGAAPNDGFPPEDEDEGEGGPPLPLPLEEEAEVRAPLPVIRDRLYGDGVMPPSRPRRADTRPTEAAAFGGEGGGGGGGAGTRPPLLPPAGGVHGAGPGSGGGGTPAPAPAAAPAGGGGGGGGGAAAPALAGLFEPPRDLITPGDLQDALAAAASAGTWLVVNIQSNAEFASHRLNRDTWTDPGLRAVLGGFTFWQACASAEAGAGAVSRYGLPPDRLPAIALVDPGTAALAALWSGWVPPDRLAEELVPFMDTPPADPAAGRLIARCRARGLHPAGKPPPGPPAPRAAAAASLPPEPAAGTPGTVRLALRLTDGARVTRSFPPDAPLGAVRAWAVSSDPAAAAAPVGRLTLRQAGGPSGGPSLTDWDAPLGGLGLGGALLAVGLGE